MKDSRIPIKSFGVSVIVLRDGERETETLLLRRVSKTLGGQWCQVAGGTDKGEAAWQTALRELREETGLIPQALYSSGMCEEYYSISADCVELAPVFVAIVGSGDAVTINHEHSEYMWVPLARAGDYLPTPNQCEMFDYIRRYFGERKPAGWAHNLLVTPPS
jgi:dATP pyrophosphohydrolase